MPPQLRRTASLWLGAITALMSGLAIGAAWCMVVLRSGHEISAFAFVCAALIAFVLRGYGFGGTRIGAVLGALCTALTCVYAQCLLAVADVAQSLGLSLRAALPQIGIEFTLAAAKARMSVIDVCLFAVAALGAAGLTWLNGRPRDSSMTGR